MFALWPGDQLNFSIFIKQTFGFLGQPAASEAGHIANTNVGRNGRTTKKQTTKIMAFPIDEQYITETEKQLGLKFQLTFKEKMKSENGGEIETADDSWTIHPFFDKSDIKRIKRTTNNIILETKESRECDNFPSTGIAIGDNGSGDKLILLPTANDPTQLSDKIYFWSHETGEVTEIADDINELVE